MNTNYFSGNEKGQNAFKEYVTSALRKIRKIRQVPAHNLYSNQHDKSLYRQQNELVSELYHSIKQLRLIFQNHPKNKGIETPDIIKNERDIVIY